MTRAQYLELTWRLLSGAAVLDLLIALLCLLALFVTREP